MLKFSQPARLRNAIYCQIEHLGTKREYRLGRYFLQLRLKYIQFS